MSFWVCGSVPCLLYLQEFSLGGDSRLWFERSRCPGTVGQQVAPPGLSGLMKNLSPLQGELLLRVQLAVPNSSVCASRRSERGSSLSLHSLLGGCTSPMPGEREWVQGRLQTISCLQYQTIFKKQDSGLLKETLLHEGLIQERYQAQKRSRK